MMHMVAALISAGIGNYGVALGTNFRNDLIANYARLSAEIMKYGEDGIDILNQNRWLEEPPQADNREALVKRG